jgi:hypothetical protein
MFAYSHEKRLQNHVNIEVSRLLTVNNITRRLKRNKPFELVWRKHLVIRWKYLSFNYLSSILC